MQILLTAAGRIAPAREPLFVPTGGVRGATAVIAITTRVEEAPLFVLFDSDAPGSKLAARLKTGLNQRAPERVRTKSMSPRRRNRRWGGGYLNADVRSAVSGLRAAAIWRVSQARREAETASRAAKTARKLPISGREASYDARFFGDPLANARQSPIHSQNIEPLSDQRMRAATDSTDYTAPDQYVRRLVGKSI